MITSGILLLIAIIVMVIMMTAMLFAVLAIVILYTGKGATYDRAGKKMAKARAGKKPKAQKKAKAK